MLLTTTDGLDGYRIERYLGVVGGESVEYGWGAYQKRRLHEAIQHATNELKWVAERAGANAVVGVHIDLELGGVVAYGTAVFVVPTREPAPVLPPPLETP